jgi:hypothetical protein
MDFKANYLHVDGSGAIANSVAGTLKFKNNIIAGVLNTTYTAGVRGASASDLASWFSTNNNTYTTSAGILTAPYNTANYNDYNANTTTIDYRPGALASTGASFSDASIAALIPVPTPVVNSKIEQVAYRGAFAPSPAAMWTDNWTNWDPKNTPYTDATNVVTISSDITTNTTWTAGTTYKLSGVIYVTNDAVLTIEPGVVVKGITGISTGTALVITKGAKLNAIGTSALPIVFTSDNAAGSRAPGDWGGVVLLGKARYSLATTGNTGVNFIEGITQTANTQYGGGTTPDDTDSSGTLKYVRIEFGGFVFSTNNEINGLTMGAVGSGTTIDYVQVSYTNDDSFEWFGGAVNCKHLVAYRGIDDDFDTDNGYKGLVQFALGIKDPALADNPLVSTSEGFESDNNNSNSNAGVTVEAGWDNTSAIFSNVTLIGPSGRTGVTVAAGHEKPLRLRRFTQLKVYNSIFMDFKTNYLEVNGTGAQANFAANTLKFQNNIIAGVPNGTYSAGVRGASASDLVSWFTASNNTYTTSAGILTAPYNTANYNDYNANTVTIDYRPGTLASTGASFADASILPFVVVGVPTTTPLTFCQGATGLSPLTAVLSTAGVSLRWYTSLATATYTTTAPTPSTAAVGIKTYYVAEVNSLGAASPRVPLTVTIIARPTIGLGAIKGIDALTAPTVNVGLYLGTTTTFTYSVVSPSVDTTITSYLWTVPSGVNIIGSATANSITVNYANVPAGAGTVGTILAQGINAAGCPGVASTLIIKKALATAPTLKMYDKNSAKPTSPLVSFGQFAGTSTPVTLVSSPIATATGYKWELPAGVSLVTGSVTPVTTTATFTAEPFLTTASAPSTVGTKYWVVSYNTYTGVDVNGVPTKIVTSTADQKIYGSTAYGGTTTAAYAKYGTVITSDLPSIIVSFAGVTAATELYLGVKSLNGVGASISNNNTVANAIAIANNVPGINYNVYTETTTPAVSPSTNATSTYTLAGTTPSTATLLKVVSVTPLAPATLVMNNGATPPVAITVISKMIGQGGTVKLLAGTSASASSYLWDLPGCVTRVTDLGGLTPATTLTSTLPYIFVKFNGTNPAAGVIYFGVKAVNNVGSSDSAIKNTEITAPGKVGSTFKLLKLVTAVPAGPAGLVLNDLASATPAANVTDISKYIGEENELTLKATASVLANSYIWYLQGGVNVKNNTATAVEGSPNTYTSNSNVITVNFENVSVEFNQPFSLVLGVKAVNNVGPSVTVNTGDNIARTDKLLTLTGAAPATPAAPTGSSAICPSAATSVTYTIAAVPAKATKYLIECPVGATVTTGTGFDASVEIDAVANATFTINYSSGFISTTAAPKYIYIYSTNGVGESAVRTLKLTNATTDCPTSPRFSEAAVANEFSVVAYPNPSSAEFTIETSAKGAINAKVYDMQGRLVENANSTQVGSSLAPGVYNVIVSQGANTKSVRVIKK